jgi:hypothetical protein
MRSTGYSPQSLKRSDLHTASVIHSLVISAIRWPIVRGKYQIAAATFGSERATALGE